MTFHVTGVTLSAAAAATGSNSPASVALASASLFNSMFFSPCTAGCGGHHAFPRGADVRGARVPTASAVPERRKRSPTNLAACRRQSDEERHQQQRERRVHRNLLRYGGCGCN